jgi:hypothetical protein
LAHDTIGLREHRTLSEHQEGERIADLSPPAAKLEILAASVVSCRGIGSPQRRANVAIAGNVRTRLRTWIAVAGLLAVATAASAQSTSQPYPPVSASKPSPAAKAKPKPKPTPTYEWQERSPYTTTPAVSAPLAAPSAGSMWTSVAGATAAQPDPGLGGRESGFNTGATTSSGFGAAATCTGEGAARVCNSAAPVTEPAPADPSALPPPPPPL